LGSFLRIRKLLLKVLPRPRSRCPPQVAPTLPGMLGLKLMTETYTVEQVLAEIPSKVTGTSAIKLVATDGQQLVLERIGKNPTTYVAYVLDVEEFNAYTTTIKTEWIDANYDTDDDDLVIWYTTGNSNNGISGGYETERSGVMITCPELCQYLSDLCFGWPEGPKQ
jgi:hypothetical protein